MEIKERKLTRALTPYYDVSEYRRSLQCTGVCVGCSIRFSLDSVWLMSEVSGVWVRELGAWLWLRLLRTHGYSDCRYMRVLAVMYAL